MLEELAVGQRQGLPLSTRALAALVKFGADRLLKWEPRGSLKVELPNGQVFRFGKAISGGEPELKLNNFQLLNKALRRGSIGFAEAYMEGDIECSDLVSLFGFFLVNIDRFEGASQGLFKARGVDRLAHIFRRNSYRGSRRNISEHYDLGNVFYRQWLDSGMNYSSAYYGGDDDQSLESAQGAKLALILDSLDLSGGESVLEIGCGWGSMALLAAQRFDAHVTGITLSQEQLDYAQKAALSQGLSDNVDFQLTDYRQLTGRYDRIVSIEMIEAVGEAYWPAYFEVLRDRLKPGGSAIIQAITIAPRHFERYRRKADFIQRYIFPGGMLPTQDAISAHAAAYGLRLADQTRFGSSYAQTLREWRQRFESAWPQVSRLGFDEEFRRKWRYYLAYCEAGFSHGSLDVGVYKLVRD